ncbi:MAG: hypothetical protein PHC89_02725 [Candidatus Pacebacteria bacterium]|nr:hypothetical protein [Candidatus Paceibacterota bacterium]
MNKQQLFKKLLTVTEYILHEQYDEANRIWAKIYPEYSLFQKPEWYEDDDLENLYTIVYKSLVYRDLSHPPVDKKDLEEAVSLARRNL